MKRLTKREEEAKSLASGGEIDQSPLGEAEAFPSRFRTLSYFFPEEDGVEIVQDIDSEEWVSVYYFDETGRVELTEGALYEWALERFESDD